ncbi:hypothetical protein BACI348_50833 [Bacillus altitudinis]|uniref:Uncharacterized protein n=1 Tax=Bacillus altitudinis TaxID=293387 RepID=A0A653XLY0_BACAB|nr:hypothetical protein BACI9J_60832 [Bacillus altitudinis]VXC31071.1 hypothetical protein BACI348_50833 [Bacillus altitudinis]
MYEIFLFSIYISEKLSYQQIIVHKCDFINKIVLYDYVK